MSFSFGTFYVYMECELQKYFVAFPSRASADRFWRAVQNIGTNDQSRECRRYSSQYYTVPALPNNVETDGWNSDDRRSCFIHPISENHPAPVAPPDSRPDNKNGGMFFIRSSLHPDYHWYYNPTNRQVEVSRTRQTMFIINRRTPHVSSPVEDILVGEDDIAISVLVNEGQERGQVVGLTRDQWNRLVPGNPENFQFLCFEGGFETGEDGVIYMTRPFTGERWEFVA